MAKTSEKITGAEEKVVLITGGAQGLGRTLAERFVEGHAKVVVLDRLPPQDLPDTFFRALLHYAQIDLANESQLAPVFQSVLEKTNRRLDILVNNAWPRLFKDFESFSSAEISAFLDAGLKASLLLVHWSLPLMKQNGYGRIIQISSQSAFKGYSSGALYCSTKMALVTFHEALSRELAKMSADLGILTICPDSFRTRENGISPAAGFVVDGICARIERFVAEGRSSVVYAGMLPGRLRLIWQLLEKTVYILKT